MSKKQEPSKVSTDGGMTADAAGAAFYDFMLEQIEQYTTENKIPWWSAIGVMSVLQSYMKDVMLSSGEGFADA